MTKDEFISIIMHETNLDANEAGRIATAVLLTLRSQLSTVEVVDIQETLPEDVEGLFEGTVLQRFMMRLQSIRSMDMDDFLEQVRESADLRTREDAEYIAQVVLHALKKAIPRTEVEHLSRDLPEELKGFWEAA